MTCRTAWAGEQLHDFEAGTPVATGCHALGAVPGLISRAMTLAGCAMPPAICMRLKRSSPLSHGVMSSGEPHRQRTTGLQVRTCGLPRSRTV